MSRIREPIAKRLGRPHTPKAGLQAGSVCDKKKVPAQLELRGRESLEQRTIPLMNHDSTRAPSRKVEPDLSRYANARIPIQQAASWLGVEITKGKFLCPSHDDHDPSASVNPDGIHWKCFPCGAGGSAIDLVMAVRQCDRDTAVNEIVGGYSGPINGHAKASTAKPKTDKPKIDYEVRPGFDTFEDCLEDYHRHAAEKREADPVRHVVYDYTPTYKKVRFFHRDTAKKIGPIPFEIHRNGRWYPAQDDTDPKRLLPLYGGQRLATISPLISQVICEGEKKCDIINAMTSETFPFVAVAGANGGKAFAGTDWTQLRGDRKIIFWPDNDTTGTEFFNGVARIVLSSGKWNSVTVIRDAMPVDDLLEGCNSDPAAVVLEFFDTHARHVRSSTMAARLNGGTAEKHVVTEDLEFLLETPNGESLFPMKRLSSVAGDGGTGKSLFLKHLAAAIADRRDFFHFSINPKYKGGLVCYLSQDEGGEGSRADIKKIGCENMDQVWSPGNLDIGTMAEIRDQIKRYMALLPNDTLSLIVVDTGDDFLSEKAAGNNDGSVKSDLNHLRELAEDTGAAVVFVKHFNKAKCRLRDRIMGSAAWTNKPRQTLVIAKDPAAGPDDVMIGIAKSNVGREAVAIGYMRLTRHGPGIIPTVTITTTDDEYSAIEARIIEAETGGRSSSIKTWPNDQIITWIIRTIRESDNGEISGIDLDERSQVAEIPVNRFMAVRKNLKDNGQIAQTNARHGAIKWFIPKGD
jgi:hypothetical protein